MAKKKASSGGASARDYGSYVVLNGQRLAIRKHPTDFSVMTRPERIDAAPFARVAPLAPSLVRAAATDSDERDRLMDEVRQDKVAHHIYEVEGTGEELIIDDRVILELRHEGTGELEQILQEYHLVYEERIGEAHVLRLTNATQRNPVKLANELAERPGVASCAPHVRLDLERHQPPALLHEQWYLNASVIGHPDVVASADIDAPEAWEITRGDPGIVVAVIDDGFDLDHPAFAGIRVHPDRWDFADNDNDPSPGAQDYHGTPVASIAVGSHAAGSPMHGIAPGCTFLPVRIGFGAAASQIDILDVFRYVSQRADVVNCSFGLPPSSFDRMPAAFRREITRLCETGGRRGKGLVMVFSAANDDAPTYLAGTDNVNGVLYTTFATGEPRIAEIPAGREVFSGYPMTPGVVVVGAMSSLKRKSGYSCWGPHLTVTAPSNNLHYIAAFIRNGADARRDRFVAPYRGLGQVAAVNRAGRGSAFSPIHRVDDPATPELREDEYTRLFGGTSGAAPVVTGVAALMLSVNPDLTAQQVRQILMATADTDLDFVLDLADDPNLQGLPGTFENGHSRFFGAGKVNAFHAVRRARALGGGAPEPEPEPAPDIAPQRLSLGTRANLPIPDNQPEGVVSHLDVCRTGRLAGVNVEVDISHPYRGDLELALVAPTGHTVRLQEATRQPGADLKRTYAPGDTPGLADLAGAGLDVRGRWSLHVSDHLNRDVGRLNTWFLELFTA